REKAVTNEKGKFVLTLTTHTHPFGFQDMNCTFHSLHWEKEISLKGYFQPESLEEALEILARKQGKARVIAGGTDVIPQLRRKELESDFLVDLSRIPGMDSIRLEDGIFAIGALLTHSRVCASELLREKARLLVEGAEALGSPQVRNISTVGGNLVSGQPAADTSLPFLALNASVRILSPRGERMVPLTEFFLGQGQTGVDSHREILTEIRFPALKENQGGCYLRLSKRKALSLPILALATVVTIDAAQKLFKDVTLAIGPVAPVPFRAAKTEAMLRGASICKEAVEMAGENASSESSPRSSSLRGSADYRKEMVKVLVRRGLTLALERAGFPISGGGGYG
ncbi:MAG: FAD binding domain-containing protein, partial [Deltaproteobacteria bacterium]|nr:FAD binding domain-containing protein [Deltaproteobacteria bacterium]